MWKVALFLVTLTLCPAESQSSQSNTSPSNYSFKVDYDNDRFLLDGKPFLYVSGSFHYFRAPHQYWRDRLRKMRAAGLNAVSTYVLWNLHQPELEVWNWQGDADLVKFLTIAAEEDLLVLLRPGPYICSERDLGGLPYWLLGLVPDIKLRTRDERYMKFTKIYLREVFKRVEPFLRGNGGPIIMVQVENEYGNNYAACDNVYMSQLQEFFAQHIGEKALLYTTDNIVPDRLKCGNVQGAYGTVDFGTEDNITYAFNLMRLNTPKGPLVNSEYYSGTWGHWGEPLQKLPGLAVATGLNDMLKRGASVNMYLFYGGSNFAFTTGADPDIDIYTYRPQITSYYFDSPMTEAGDLTEKYHAIKNVISKYLPIPNVAVTDYSPKGDYGVVQLNPVAELFDPIARSLFGTETITAKYPPTMESLKLPHWLLLCEKTLPEDINDNVAVLRATAKDRAMIYQNDKLTGLFSRTYNTNTVALQHAGGSKIKILVENQGRLNVGNDLHDFKGLFNATLNDIPLTNWNVTGFKMDSVKQLDSIHGFINVNVSTAQINSPTFFKGNFTVNGDPLDTYLDTSGWGKGAAFVNGFNLGRYWPMAGPQITLYIPGVYLKTGLNELVILELEYVKGDKTMKLQNFANLG